jgi:hypothetical protein
VSDLKLTNRESALAWIGTPGFDAQGNAAPYCLKPSSAQGSSVSEFQPASNPIAALFDGLGKLFGLGGGQAQSSPAAFDLGALLSKVFELFGPKAQTQDTQSTDTTQRARAEGRFEGAGFSGEGSAEAEAYARTTATGRTWAGPDGVGAEGSVGATAGVYARTKGALRTPLGSVQGHAAVSAEIYARAKGYVIANTKGADAAGMAEVGARARAEASANAELLGGFFAGSANAEAESGSAAVATGHAAISYDPPTAVLQGSAGAFAGARAGFSAQGGIAGIGYGVEAEAWAGVGAKAEFHAGLDKDGKFRISAGVGAAIGVGAFLRLDLEFDFKDLGATVSSVVGAGAAVVGGVLSAAGSVVGGVVKGVGDVVGGVFGGIFGAVAGLFGGGRGDGSHAAQLVEAFKPMMPAVLPAWPLPEPADEDEDQDDTSRSTAAFT